MAQRGRRDLREVDTEVTRLRVGEISASAARAPGFRFSTGRCVTGTHRPSKFRVPSANSEKNNRASVCSCGKALVRLVFLRAESRNFRKSETLRKPPSEADISPSKPLKIAAAAVPAATYSREGRGVTASSRAFSDTLQIFPGSGIRPTKAKPTEHEPPELGFGGFAFSKLAEGTRNPKGTDAKGGCSAENRSAER